MKNTIAGQGVYNPLPSVIPVGDKIRSLTSQGEAKHAVSRSPFEPIDIPDEAWHHESTRRILHDRAAGLLFEFAQKYGVSQTRLAAATGISQARINDLIKGRRGNITAFDAWERIANGLNMPDHARTTLGLAPTSAAALNRSQAGSDHAKRVEHLSFSEEISSLTSGIAFSNTSDEAIDRIARATASLAESHTQVSAEKLLSEALGLHRQTKTLLDEQQRLSQKRELFRIESDLLAHVCLLFGDLQRNSIAERYGEVSLLYAREAGSNQAVAWSVRAKTLRWQKRFVESADMARQGFDCSPPTPIRIQLANQEANAAALLGDASRAREALRRAEAATGTVQPDSGVSAWSFPIARQAIFSLSVAIHTNDPDAALRAAATAEAGWDSGVPKVAATWAQVCTGAGIAHLMKGSLDGAIEEVDPVLTLAPELRVSTVTAYIESLDQRLAEPRFKQSKDAIALRRRIREFNSNALPKIHLIADAR